LASKDCVDPKIMVGKPVIRGTRIRVELIVHMLGQGISEEEILEEYPRLGAEDIRAALQYNGSIQPAARIGQPDCVSQSVP
jgi:uncharacterized protein (DUF433 family)